MTATDDRVKQRLALTPLANAAIPYFDWLTQLSEHPEWADSAAALIFRAIVWMGEEEPADEPDPDRRRYLQMLKDFGIPSYNAFKHVSGSQRFVTQIMGFLRSAGAGGAQRQKMMIIRGGPGSGKDYLLSGIFQALELYTEAVEKVYTIEHCPQQENPINVLKLLRSDTLRALAADLGLPQLVKLVDLACEPCQECYELVMGSVASPTPAPTLENLRVVPMRLSTRGIGLAEWQPSGTVGLAASLGKGNRGMASLPDAFIERKPREGETDERLLLLDATQFRRLPPTEREDGLVTSASPLDCVVGATTNKKALSQFLYGDPDNKTPAVVPDADAFTSRAQMMDLAYGTVRADEVHAYKNERRKFKDTCDLDPLVLPILATVAVVSRLPKPRKKGKFVHPLDTIALYQGERIEPKIRPESDFDAVWGAIPYGYKTEEELPPLPDGVPLSAPMLWQFADPNEGLSGLDMRAMMGLLSSINQLGLQSTEEAKCVNSLQVLAILRNFIAARVKAKSNNTTEQQAIYERLLRWLGGTPTPNAAPSDKPELIEAEYRRMLRTLLLQVFAPDYDERAQKLFADYRMHAQGWLQNKPSVRDPQLGQVPTNTGLLDELDRFRLDKPITVSASGARVVPPLTEADKAFRSTIDTLISALRDRIVAEQGAEAAAESFKVTWETIPELAKAIRAKLDSEIGAVMEKLIKSEVQSNLTGVEVAQLERVMQALTERGFCKTCLRPILEYAKRTSVWAFKLN